MPRASFKVLFLTEQVRVVLPRCGNSSTIPQARDIQDAWRARRHEKVASSVLGLE
jgi:hypothetical protein